MPTEAGATFTAPTAGWVDVDCDGDFVAAATEATPTIRIDVAGAFRSRTLTVPPVQRRPFALPASFKVPAGPVTVSVKATSPDVGVAPASVDASLVRIRFHGIDLDGKPVS